MSIFQDNTKSIPMDGDSRVNRIEFGKSDIGARKSHTGRIGSLKNDMSIQHVPNAPKAK